MFLSLMLSVRRLLRDKIKAQVNTGKALAKDFAMQAVYLSLNRVGEKEAGGVRNGLHNFFSPNTSTDKQNRWNSLVFCILVL